MKNPKVAFFALVVASLGFAASMAAANGGHVQAPSYVNVLPEQTIVGELPARTIELAPITIVGSIGRAKHATAPRAARVAQIRVTDLEQGGAPGAEAVTRIN
jgi:hypothetical protein